MRFINVFFLQFLLIISIVVGCSRSKRPSEDTFNTTITGRTILSDATVRCENGSGEEIASGVVGDDGAFNFSIDSVGETVLYVCGGSYDTPAGKIAFSGCLQSSLIVSEETQIATVVDFISTFITAYESDTSRTEWLAYLNMNDLVFPTEENSVTDATKAYLFTQGLIQSAQDASSIDSAGETLFTKLLDDLKDDNTINGSTKETIGSINIGENIFRQMIPEATKDIFPPIKTEDWRDHLATAPADFLGSGGSGDEKTLSIKIYQGEDGTTEADYYHGIVTVKATAENFDTVKDFTCSHDGGIGDLTDENAADSYFEAVVDIAALDNGSYTVSCELSDGSQLYTEQTPYEVDNNAPDISIAVYKTGTKEDTGTEENPARGTVDITAEATHKSYAIEDLYCIIDADETATTDTDSADDTLHAEFDTTTIPDGENTVICTALVSGTEYNAQSTLHVNNKADVTIKPFIAYPLQPTDDTTVTFIDSDDTEHVATIDSGTITAELQLNETYTVKVQNGQFRSTTLSTDEDDLKTYSGTLTARVTVSTDTTQVIVTPLTTLSQKLHTSITENAPSRDADSEAISLIEGHYGSGVVPLTDAPANNKTNDAATRAFIAGAAFEELAYYIETVEFETNPGTIPVSEIINTLTADLSGDPVLDGQNNTSALTITDGTSVFPADSYLYRKFYAVAIQNFMGGDHNPTTLGAMQNMVDNTAEDNSILFPSDDAPIPVSIDGPSVTVDTFKILWPDSEEETEDFYNDADPDWQAQQDYIAGDTTPIYNTGFIVTFAVTPNSDENQELDAAFTTLTAPEGYDTFVIERLIPQNYTEPYTTTPTNYTYRVHPPQAAASTSPEQLDFTITVRDTAYNKTTATVQTTWDCTAPHVAVTTPDNPVRPEDAEFTWNITEDHLILEKYTVSKETGDGPETSSGDLSGFTEMSIQSFISGLNADDREGDYTVTVTATDTAGNVGSGEGVITVDTTPPAFTFDVSNDDGTPVPDGGADNRSEYTIQLIKDNPEEPVFFSSTASQNDGGYESSIDFTAHSEKTTHTHTGIIEGGTYTVSVWARDNAGNTSNPQTQSMVIDKTAPSINEGSLDFNPYSHPLLFGGLYGLLWICSEEHEGEDKLLTYGAPGIWFNASDNYFDQGDITVRIRNLAGGEWQTCQYRNNGYDDSCGPFFVCDAVDGESGDNTYEFEVSDPLGNTNDSFTKQITLDLDGPVQPEVELSDTYLNDRESGITVSWTEDVSADSYNCTVHYLKYNPFTGSVTPQYVTDCTNGGTITAADIDADTSGNYEVEVQAVNSNGGASDTAEFSYFDFDDLIFTVSKPYDADISTEVRGSPGSLAPRVELSTYSKAPIDTVTVYLSNHYVFGQQQSSSDFEVCHLDYTDTTPRKTGLDGTLACRFPAGFTGGTYLQLKVKAVIDGETVWKETNNTACIIDPEDESRAFSITDWSYDDDTGTCQLYKHDGDVLYYSYKKPSDTISTYSYSYIPYKCVDTISGSSVSVNMNYPDKMTCGGDEYYYSQDPYYDKTVSWNANTETVTVSLDMTTHGRAGALYFRRLHDDSVLSHYRSRNGMSYTVDLPDTNAIGSCGYHFSHTDLSLMTCEVPPGGTEYTFTATDDVFCKYYDTADNFSSCGSVPCCHP